MLSDECKVMEYDTTSGKWAALPPYRARDFAMTVISNLLVLVGGWEHDQMSKVVGVWRADRREWTHPYSEMHTARSHCSAAVYNEWLVVAGGHGDNGVFSSVEVLNTDSKQWYAGPPMPTGWYGMKTALVGDMCYFMGGWSAPSGASSASASLKVYSMSLSGLTSQLHSQEPRERSQHHHIWKEITGLQVTQSTPLSISEALLAISGVDKDGTEVSAIRLYQPDTGEWVKVGDLPGVHCACTCAIIGNRELLVAGGLSRTSKYLSRTDLAEIHY